MKRIFAEIWNRIRTAPGVLLGTALLAIAICLVLLGIANRRADALADQSLGLRWSAEGDAAQIAAYFSVDAGIAPEKFDELRYKLDRKLADSGIFLAEGADQAGSAAGSGAAQATVSADPVLGGVPAEPDYRSARLYADAYAATGSLTVANGKRTVTASALGVDGDFFLFHPLSLLSGNYFSGDELNQDYILLDETSAWQLFGSSDIAGQIVTVGDIPLIVRGVYRPEEGRIAQGAGIGSQLLFVSYGTLVAHGISYGVCSYEVVMPDPIDDFACAAIAELLALDDAKAEIIDCTHRFSLASRFAVLRSFGTRSMNGKAIIYPYWENIARGTEDTVCALTLAAGILMIYGVIVLGIFAVLAIRRIPKRKLTVWFGNLWNRVRGWFLERKRSKAQA